MKQIRDNITVAMRKTAGRMSASVVSDAEQLRQLMRNDNAYQFLQNVRGSPAYFQRAVREPIAIVAELGCPQFFLTVVCRYVVVRAFPDHWSAEWSLDDR